MSPAAATATARAPRRVAAPAHEQRRPPLRVVPPRRRRRDRRNALAEVVGVALVMASLLVVVAGHAYLAGGQLQLSTDQSRLAVAQSTHRHDMLAVAVLENPNRVVNEAQHQGYQPPATVTQLPAVSLSTPLPAPHLSAPPAPAAGSTASSSTGGGATQPGQPSGQ